MIYTGTIGKYILPMYMSWLPTPFQTQIISFVSRIDSRGWEDVMVKLISKQGCMEGDQENGTLLVAGVWKRQFGINCPRYSTRVYACTGFRDPAGLDRIRFIFIERYERCAEPHSLGEILG